MYKQFTNLTYPLMSPEDKISGAGIAELGKEEIIEFLNDDSEGEKIELDKPKGDKKSDDKDEKTEGEEKEELSEGEEELKEIEEELEEPEEEKLEFTTPVSRREILKKYPNVFKEFPYLEKAYYRERQFTEMFPTIDEAKEAVEDSKTLKQYESDLRDGNLAVALQTIKDESPKNFDRVVDNYLKVLSEIDEKSSQHVIGNIIRTTISAMVQESRSSNNEALQSAATILNQFVFGSSNFQPPTRLSSDKPDPVDEERTKFEKERSESRRRDFENTRDGLNSRVGNSIKATIAANIDLKDAMTPYVKKAASNEAYETLVSLIDKDSRFKILLDKLWEKAFSNNFDDSSKENIRKAYLSKAKTLLPAVIKQARNEALKGIGKRVKDDSEEAEESESNEKNERRSAPQVRERKTTSKAITSAKDIPKGMRSIDFLMQD